MQDVFCEECGTGPHNLASDMERAERLDQSIQRAIARRFFDFAKHAFYELDIYRSGSLDRAVQCIPDLNKWPNEAEYPRTNQ
jgi:hypothetical protein